MDDLAKRIRATLDSPNSEPWFPGLTADLAAQAWNKLRCDIGVSPNSYGTGRVTSHNSSAPRDIIVTLETYPQSNEKTPGIAVEVPALQWDTLPNEVGQKRVDLWPPDLHLLANVLEDQDRLSGAPGLEYDLWQHAAAQRLAYAPANIELAGLRVGCEGASQDRGRVLDVGTRQARGRVTQYEAEMIGTRKCRKR